MSNWTWPGGLRVRGGIVAVAQSRPASWFLRAALFWVVAAACFSGFYEKWGLYDGYRTDIGLKSQLDRTGMKPFVYRQLMPLAANAADRYIPFRIKEKIIKQLPVGMVVDDRSLYRDPAYRFRFVLVYYAVFASILISLYGLRQILREVGVGDPLATAIPSAFMLAFPYLEVVGGYCYDSVELMFLAMATLAALRGRVWQLLLLTVPATLNKESFFFFIPTLYPLLPDSLARGTARRTLVASVLLAGAVNGILKIWLIHLPGQAACYQLSRNLQWYSYLSTYFTFRPTYGLAGPLGVSVLTLMVIGLIAVRAWPRYPVRVQRHLGLATIINIPLFILFCCVGETRNLSLMYVGFIVLMAFAVPGSKAPATPGAEVVP